MGVETQGNGAELNLRATPRRSAPATFQQGINVDKESGLRLGADGFLPAFGRERFGRGSFIGKLNHHNLGGKFLRSMQVEINRGTFGIRLGYYAQSVLKVSDALPFRD